MQKHIKSYIAKFLCALIFITLFTITLFTFLNTSSSSSNPQPVLPHSIRNHVVKLQTDIGILLNQLRNENSESTSISNFSDQVLSIALSLDRLSNSISELYTNPSISTNETSTVDEDFSEPTENEDEEQEGLATKKVFQAVELKNYTSPKLNRYRGKKNFLGLDAINPSIGLGCANMALKIDTYMSYKVDSLCPDDWDLAQKLMLSGCEPLPRRRCFSRAAKSYNKPFPFNSSLWAQPDNANILWSRYKCKDYNCLFSSDTVNKRGFYKCSDCFNLTKRGWEVPGNESDSAEFTIDQVLSLKPGEIRIGLDFSPTTGTFAAIMRERNVTIISTTLNLGAPFNEVISLRGLVPLYISIGSRLPFFDNTLDIVHSTLFLDGWVGLDLLEFVVFDWDRVIRPKGILWIDRFFCKKNDLDMYLSVFSKIGYKKLMWRVVPKKDKEGDELFFSAVLEKPTRG